MPFLQRCLTVTLLLLTISFPAIAKTQATASISSNQVFLGDTFVLTVEVNDTGSDYQLDTSKLVEIFTVYRPSRSQQTSYINGDYSETTTWSLRLQAKSTGEFTIPALKLGNALTKPITIQVKQPGKQQQATQGDVIFIENTVNKESVYLAQPIILETKLFISKNISDAEIQKPTLEGASIEPVGTNQQSQVIRNGVRYQMLTYQYQITPTVAGDFSITSPLLTGSVRQVTRINYSQNRVTNDPINVRGNNIDITVKALPTNFEGDWLVSEDVRLIENNDLQQKEYNVGDPITRSISLQIASISPDKMPEIKLNYPGSLRYYPDQDDIQQGTVEDLLYSQRTITHAIIASESGVLILPEIKIPWWNSVTEKQEFAVLPAQTITINAAKQDKQNQQYNNIQTTQNLANITNTSNNTNQNNGEHSAAELLVWQISTLVLLLLLILSVFYHLQQKKLNKESSNRGEPLNAATPPYQQLLATLSQNKDIRSQPVQSYVHLLRYFQSQQSSLTQLQQVGEFTHLEKDKTQQLLENLEQLELACAGKTHQWDAKQLVELIKLHHKVTKPNNENSLANINP